METQIVTCAACGGDGGWESSPTGYCHQTGVPTTHWIKCEHCDGRGEYEETPEPVTEDDLCKVCNTPISSAELCAECAKGNDPFFSSKYSGDYRP